MKFKLITLLFLLTLVSVKSQNTIPIDTTHWQIQARSYVIESYKGKSAIYLQGGFMKLKDQKFLNGTIEFDIYLKELQAFPGVYFRIDEESNGEQFFLRPHLSGKPDANQAAPLTHGITPWQLYFGPRYSFPYTYNYEDWTHVKIIVNERKAQVFLNYAKKPNLSWNLFHKPKSGDIGFRGGNRTGLHIANIKIDHSVPKISGFAPVERKPIEGLIQKWEISDSFEENKLDDINNLTKLISNRKWNHEIVVEEGTAANISRKVNLVSNRKKNTVFARVTIHSNKKQTKLIKFGYSDRVVAILNGKPIYKGTNKWRSRDYRYLGTVGLFDGVYLPLKKGKNILLMAVSEDFGGWLITGKFNNEIGLKY